MYDIKALIEKNEGKEFVFHTRTEEELDALVDALEELDFEFSLPFLGTIREMAAQFSEEDGFDGCWRISRERGVAYNDSVEHWRMYTNDIVEIRNGEIEFNDGFLTQTDADIEAEKLRRQFHGEDANYVKQLFRLADDAGEEEIEALIKKKTKLTEE